MAAMNQPTVALIGDKVRLTYADGTYEGSISDKYVLICYGFRGEGKVLLLDAIARLIERKQYTILTHDRTRHLIIFEVKTKSDSGDILAHPVRVKCFTRAPFMPKIPISTIRYNIDGFTASITMYVGDPITHDFDVTNLDQAIVVSEELFKCRDSRGLHILTCFYEHGDQFAEASDALIRGMLLEKYDDEPCRAHLPQLMQKYANYLRGIEKLLTAGH